MSWSRRTLRRRSSSLFASELTRGSYARRMAGNRAGVRPVELREPGPRANEEIMKTRYVAIAVAAIAGAIGLAACGGGSAEPASAPSVPAAPLDSGSASGTVPAGHVLTAGEFVGMSLDQAGSYAEELGRQWRVGREDGADLPVTADVVSGRVTFTI
jgi:hypothetical protein